MDSHKTSVVAGGARFKEYLDRTKMEHKQYQYDGVQWMLNNELRADPVTGVRGGFIADEMGLGKTIMMIGTMLCNFRARTLIVVPPVLVDQWYAQIYRTTGHKPLIYHGNKKKQISQFLLSQATIVITTYGAITLTKKQIDANAVTPLHQLQWARVIFDEAHHLRNKNTTRHISAKKLQANIRWLVSGTPVQNRRQDFYSLCSLLGLPASFYTEVDNLPKLTADFVLKRTKNGVGIKMPNVVHGKNMVSWGNRKEMELSEEIHSALGFSHVSASKSRDFVANSLSRGGVLSLILRARQTCIYPKLLSKTLSQNDNLSTYSEAFNCSSKLDFALDKILQRKDNGCGKLIFCHFREEIDEIAARLRAGGWLRWRHLMGGPLAANAWKLSTIKMTHLYCKFRPDVRGSICRKTTAKSTSYRRIGIRQLKTRPSHGVTELGRQNRCMLSGLRCLRLRPWKAMISYPPEQWIIT